MEHRGKRILCYLRTHRRLWGLTQRELASLMGFKSKQHVSRIENGRCPPTMRNALACQVIFGVTPAAMFPDSYEVIEQRVIREIYEMHLGLEGTSSPSDLRKRDLLSRALERAITKI